MKFKLASLIFILFLLWSNSGNAQVYYLGNTAYVPGWYKLGTLNLPQGGADAEIKIITGGGYNANPDQLGECVIHFRTSNSDSQNNGFYASGTFYKSGRTTITDVVRVIQINQSTWDFYAYLPAFTGPGAALSLTSILGIWTSNFTFAEPPLNAISVNLKREFVINNEAYFSGNVGIGTLSPSSYKLAVGGAAIAESITVKLQGNWPDYVFEPTYKMLNPAELESYILQNKHLPDLPSAAAVEKEGLDLGEMNKKLLKKIEELTLYMISQQKEIDQLKAYSANKSHKHPK